MLAENPRAFSSNSLVSTLPWLAGFPAHRMILCSSVVVTGIDPGMPMAHDGDDDA
jgi:hypothetical protein